MGIHSKPKNPCQSASKKSVPKPSVSTRSACPRAGGEWVSVVTKKVYVQRVCVNPCLKRPCQSVSKKSVLICVIRGSCAKKSPTIFKVGLNKITFSFNRLPQNWTLSKAKAQHQHSSFYPRLKKPTGVSSCVYVLVPLVTRRLFASF